MLLSRCDGTLARMSWGNMRLSKRRTRVRHAGLLCSPGGGERLRAQPRIQLEAPRPQGRCSRKPGFQSAQPSALSRTVCELPCLHI